jgi:glycosyltransferase involved in cell wall biosynthesis
MKLLIVTQAVDTNDPVLGFFHRWIEEFAKHCESVEVICLRSGVHALPSTVRVHQLPASGRLSRTVSFLKLAYVLRGEYDAVFVHMNPEYLLAAGALWKLLRKKTTLWYTHKSVNLRLRVGVLFADKVCTASKESFRLRSNKALVMGHGIDTDFFSPSQEERSDAVLSAGRFSPTKRHDLVLRAGQYFNRPIWYAGEGPESKRLLELAEKLKLAERVRFLGARTQRELRELYRRSGVFAHASETGSMDKVVLEALLCGLPVVSTSEAFKSLLEPHGLYSSDEPKEFAAALESAQGRDISALGESVRGAHALSRLIPRILALYA